MKETAALIVAIAGLVSALATLANTAGSESGQKDCSAVLVPIIEAYAETCGECTSSED